MTTPKHQHIVPQFYLKRFCRAGHLWVYDIQDGEYREQTPKNTAVRTKYYTGTDEIGNPTVDFEILLSNLEGVTEPVIAKLSKGGTLTGEDLGVLAYFVSYLFIRVPRFQEWMDNIVEGAAVDSAKKMFDSEEAARRTIQHAAAGGIPLSIRDAKDISEFLRDGKLGIRISKDYSLAIRAELGSRFAHAFGACAWDFIRAPANSSFITSDNPVSIVSPQGFDAAGNPIGGIREPEVHKVVPLSSRILLRIGDELSDAVSFTKASTTLTDTLNYFIARNAKRFLIGPDRRQLESIVRRLKPTPPPV